MTYRITGLVPDEFTPYFLMSEAELAARGAQRVIAQADRGHPCRISLEDARKGEALILLQHVSHDVATPYRSAYAIYVREGATRASYEDAVPPVFEGRPLGLRGFDAAGMLHDARLALPGEADAAIRALFADPQIAYIDAHNAAHGCFAARITRYEA
ncbi:MAG: DUF1203 domain-containing protein [Sphingomonadales bacterium]|nr:DUF1203 domain-containing protein [Sphingomonadales bacterium]MBD3772575.1 DUF1203 domain-containing protein [Paracoccaceae bacterium]